ncbi:alpha-mannosidase [Sphingomonas naasensis]|uniref:Alpha-mannosidase n=1 Tax=Sphingomonas naasensis TaxID=1344951 RepID=A0A4S1WN64_9SPHN|nr:alpha-mannosidase [Sphingomonas naasensis]
MRLGGAFVLALLLAGQGSAQDGAADDPLSAVNVFVGADNNGNTVPGAGVPFGFVAFSPDTVRGSTNGYDGASPLTGFSVTHVSGTGGESKYGNFRVTPTIGPVDPRNLVLTRSGEEGAPGYYATRIGAIRAELTAARMAGMARFTFPVSGEANLIIDATSAIQLMGKGPRAVGAQVQMLDARTLGGTAEFVGGWNAAPLKLHFAATFDRDPIRIGGWNATRGSLSVKPGAGANGGDQRIDPSDRVGGFATFDTRSDRVVRMKIAVSFASVEQARANLAELPGWDFDARRLAAAELWRDALGRIAVEGGSATERRNFYSALYRSHTMPHDVSGERVGESAPGRPHYEDYYTLWDTFRTLHPLLTLIQPERQRAMINSLLDTYSETGWLPDARIAGANGMTQGGSNGDVLIADAVVKELGGFDRALAWQAIRKDGDVESDDPTRQGRVLRDYLALGYVSQSETRAASRTLEYAYDDFAIAEVAAAMGKHDEAARFFRRSANWQRLWDDGLKCIRPRYADGGWMPDFDCNHVYPDNSTAWWDAPFYEGSSRQYSTYVPHDPAGLIARLGGAAGFVAWLDTLFDTEGNRGGYEHGNEPDFLAAYLYVHAGRPDRTADRVRAIMATLYRPTHDGLPGNDDAGAMSSWYVWSAMGLFPNAGQPFYYIGSPLFTRSIIALQGGRRFEVRASRTSADRRYVVAARLNGAPLDRAWITHRELAAGGVLELDMAERPGAWATRFRAPPNPYHPDPEQRATRGK